MALRIGARLYSVACDAQVIVIAAPKVDVTLLCGGAPMVDEPATGDQSRHASATGGGVAVGKRYEDSEVGLEVLATKAGAGTLEVDGRPLTIKEPKRLPASD
ncbi:hypothetical protein Rhow_006705 [Rhodococcus wratislaviensis]|jgi:hypothetical protein|uniref:Uncharacterized protein n=1 Tax=Rhodococcus wratislaviensis TaxID=44752 RepID=A0A402CG09_RHOWR|nr:hypothetical protein [Rhodococcus wratislaviensis]GCE42576.1 hypothetical protein Rhow_006705 [Rhodococcus wratislaviensis]